MTLDFRSDEAKPLPERIRPATFDELSGQPRLFAPGSALRRLVESDRWSGLLFWGPPGTGKTTAARVIGRASSRPLRVLSAVQHGVKDIREVIQESKGRLESGETAILVFMDEIHRLNKNQQDVLLPALEAGEIRFIGATTENPSFEVNDAILSRVLVFKLTSLGVQDLVQILSRALQHPDSKLVRRDLEQDVLEAVARAASGDARRALNLLEAVAACAPADASPVNVEALRDVAKDIGLCYDRAGDAHYDTISAFIKSVRASHPDAALHYLARMLDAGEDPLFLARRLVILASEDVGNANPTALLVATSGMQAVHMIGMPEVRIILSQVTTYLAASPKSNRAYLAIDEAWKDVREIGSAEIPLYLRNAPTKFMKELGYGKGYTYPHDDLEGARNMPYLPSVLKGRRYYRPSDAGTEAQLKKNLERLRPHAD